MGLGRHASELEWGVSCASSKTAELKGCRVRGGEERIGHAATTSRIKTSNCFVLITSFQEQEGCGLEKSLR